MSPAKFLHDQAMALVDQALAAERVGDEVIAQNFLRQAFEFEKQAADSVASDIGAEPTRSILYRSAATLALRCGMPDAARHLASQGLAGTPPTSVRNELNTVATSAETWHHSPSDEHRSRIREFFSEAGWTIDHTLALPAKVAQFFDIGELQLQSQTSQYLRSLFPKGIYQHQLLALGHFGNGENICLATGTASGKSMVFYAAAIDYLVKNPKKNVLVVYPLKALAREQEVRFNDAVREAGLDATVARIDGQVPVSSRTSLVRKSRILILTPDIIHAWMMSSVADPTVRSFLKRLGLVIVDEVHNYTGVFGSNSAFLFRRIQHLVELLGGRFSYIGASATIANPDLHLRNLFGVEFHIIGPEADTSPRHAVQLLLITPPQFGDLLSELTTLLRYLATDGKHRFIAFVDSRKQVEYLSAIIRRSDDRNESEAFRADHLQSMQVLPFRAGYELEDLNTIQGRISTGAVRGVISTSALELGMDIPFLDTGVLVGVPMSRTSLLQRIGRIGRHKPGLVIIINRGSLQDKQAFQDADAFMARPLTESSLYLENQRIQYLHVLCLARHGGEHDSAIGGGSGTDTEFASAINWPPGFLELCQKERIGEISPDLQPMKMEGGESPNHVFPLRDVESQFQVELKQGPNLRSLGSLSHGQVMREAYPGAVYYYTGQPFRIYRVFDQAKKIQARSEAHYTTKPTALPTLVFPNLSAGNVQRAARIGELTAIDCNVQIREVLVGYKERRGPNEINIHYPLSSLEGGIRFDLPRFTRNYFTTGVILTHPSLSGPGVRVDMCSQFVYEAFLSLLPFERQDVGAAADKHRSERDFVSRGQSFIAIYDQTYGSLRLSSRMLDDDLLPKVFLRTRELVDASDLREAEPLTARAVDAFTSDAQGALKNIRLDGVATAAGQSGNMIRVIMPGSRGVDIQHNNDEFFVSRIFFSPTLQSVAYRGRHETTSEEGVVEIIGVDSLVPIPGESRIGVYDPETGELQEVGEA
ncbi:MAG: DEAD/DEAH box helicase [Bryobacteraceae bacterium]|jgi:DEAD/DEAH box helicase domain-containing protein